LQVIASTVYFDTTILQLTNYGLQKKSVFARTKIIVSNKNRNFPHHSIVLGMPKHNENHGLCSTSMT